MSNFEDLDTTKKGNVAEDIVGKKLIEAGYFVYKSITNKPHHFDYLIYDKDGNMSALEIKCKELRDKYPDTGFPLTSYKKYKKINDNIKFIVLFIDYKKGEIYGNEIDKLIDPVIVEINGKHKQYPSIESHNIIYFLYENMKVYAKLNKEEIIKIKEVSDNLKKNANKGE